MSTYQAHFLDYQGRTYLISQYDAHNDAEAVEAARVPPERDTGPGVEVWEGRRLVHSEKRDT